MELKKLKSRICSTYGIEIITLFAAFNNEESGNFKDRRNHNIFTGMGDG